MKFDLVQIIGNLENERLLLGKKIGNFLLVKLQLFFKKIDDFFKSKNAALISVSLIIILNILAKSSRDIGHDSAAYLEIAGKILSGGNYFTDFFEANMPLCFLTAILAVILAKITNISTIISAEILFFMQGILSLYFANKILQRSKLIKNQTTLNLIIIAFAFGYFFRVYSFAFNEFLTKSSLLLIILFPYVSYQLIDSKFLKRSDNIICAFLAAALFCLKINYIIFAVLFELKRMWDKKSFFSVFCLRNYLTLVIILSYFSFVAFYFDNFFENMSQILEIYFQEKNNVIYQIIIFDLTFPLLLCFLCSDLIKKDKILQIFFIFSLSAAILITSEFIAGHDQKFVFFSAILPLIFLLIFKIITKKLVNFKQDWFFIILILTIPHFDFLNSYDFLSSLVILWFVPTVIFLFKQKNRSVKYQNILQRILVPNSYFFVAIFISLIVISYYFAIYLPQIGWTISLILFFLNVKFHQNINQKNGQFSSLTSFVIFAIFSFILGMHLFFLNPKNSAYQSPSYKNEQLIKIMNKHLNKDQEAIFIGTGIHNFYPAIIYAGRENKLPFLQLARLYNVKYHEQNLRADSYLLQRLEKQMLDEKNKLIFIAKKGSYLGNKCDIGFLENNFQNLAFKKAFLNNYQFLNRIIEQEDLNNEPGFFANEAVVLNENKKIINDIEIYVRK